MRRHPVPHGLSVFVAVRSLTLAAVLVRLGRVEEARAVIAAFREQEPDFTVATMENFAFQNRAYLERWMADLRTAGLPD
jgi:hypothetical protein